MNIRISHRQFLLSTAAVLASTLFVAGCHNESAHPDEKSIVTSSLNNNNLSAVGVSQDREKGVITLTGNVDTDAQKSQAETLTRQAAPDYTVADEIGVRPPAAPEASAVASNLDTAIDHNYKAAIKAHKNLDDQSIHYSVKNGTIVLTGSVKTASQKSEAYDLAKHVPNVHEVVNEIEVKPGKNSTSTP